MLGQAACAISSWPITLQPTALQVSLLHKVRTSHCKLKWRSTECQVHHSGTVSQHHFSRVSLATDSNGGVAVLLCCCCRDGHVNRGCLIISDGPADHRHTGKLGSKTSTMSVLRKMCTCFRCYIGLVAGPPKKADGAVRRMLGHAATTSSRACSIAIHWKSCCACAYCITFAVVSIAGSQCSGKWAVHDLTLWQCS